MTVKQFHEAVIAGCFKQVSYTIPMLLIFFY